MVETLDDILRRTIEEQGSDIFVVPGSPIMTKTSGRMIRITEERAMPDDITALVDRAYELAGRNQETLHEAGDDDFSFAVHNLSRFRCNTYRQRGSLAMTCRVVTFGIPDPKERNIPDVVMRLAELRSGMILVTGPAGSGKSTTLACLVDRINSTRSGHIITIEDPIEYLHPHKQCIVSQREVPWTLQALPAPCAQPCARHLTPSCWVKCAISKRFPPLLPQRKPATCCCPPCIQWVQRKPLTGL